MLSVNMTFVFYRVKVGIVQDSTHRVRLAKLLRFPSSHTVIGSSIKVDDKISNMTMTTLEQYVERMKPGQEQIYYMAGPNIPHIAASPLLETVLSE